jgi:predicted RecB family nuclease
VLKVDQSLARSLRDIGVGSYDQLLRNFDEPKLSEFRKQHGNKSQKVGKAAPDILLSARALQTQKTIPIARPQIPPGTNFVMFDLEGLPPHLDELEKIYLWGVKVFGERPSVFMAATAGFGVEGDRAGWEHFLKNVRQVIDDYGHIPFVHWHHYERTKLNMYIDRYGDPDGLASIVRDNLFNLLPATQNSVMLPLPSYSLKVVESYVGFKRSQKDYGGDWAMAKYIEATEMKDREGRDKVVAEILKYNEEDLAATWAVFCWVRDYGQHMNATARQD